MFEFKFTFSITGICFLSELISEEFIVKVIIVRFFITSFEIQGEENATAVFTVHFEGGPVTPS